MILGKFLEGKFVQQQEQITLQKKIFWIINASQISLFDRLQVFPVPYKDIFSILNIIITNLECYQQIVQYMALTQNTIFTDIVLIFLVSIKSAFYAAIKML
jgi:hypothetical protein